MSIEYTAYKISPAAAEAFQQSPETLASLFEGDGDPPEDFDRMKDAGGLEYWDADHADPWTKKATGDGFGRELDFEGNYGPVVIFTPDEVRQLAKGLASEWPASGSPDENLRLFFELAAEEGKYVVGGFM